MIMNSPVIQSFYFILSFMFLICLPASFLPTPSLITFLHTATIQMNTADVDIDASSLDISAVMLNYVAGDSLYHCAL